MSFISKNTYAKNEVTSWPVPNYWDAIAIIFVLAILILLSFGAKALVGKFQLTPHVISLNPAMLPYYALRTILRMFIAMFFSLVFTFIFGAFAAKNQHAERVIIPMIDILQSVPVLGFLTITVVGFISLFPGSMLGPECAAIFAIFTAQVWNMTLSFYQSLRTIPEELKEASFMFQLSAWQRFWKLEVPFAMPGLLWNAMMSMSGSWVFLVAAESISVANQNIALPGIGSYIAMAIAHTDKWAILYVIITMLVVIMLYDQLLFRPLVAWAQKFKTEMNVSEEESESWVLNLFQRTRFLGHIGQFFGVFANTIVNWKIFRKHQAHWHQGSRVDWRRFFIVLYNTILIFAIVFSLYVLFRFIFSAVSFRESVHVLYLGFLTALRVNILIVLSSLFWVPVGVWIGLRPRITRLVQPVAQFLAAFPANLVFPIAVIVIIQYHLNVNIWTSPLMILGTQWYIVFNVIAGTSALPRNLHYVVNNLNVQGWLWWKRFILPGIFPYYVTGAITAAGGAWNMSIIAEYVSWGNQHLIATGLGAYVAQVSSVGDFPRLALGIAVMSLYVLGINRLMWRPLYNLAVSRYQIN